MEMIIGATKIRVTGRGAELPIPDIIYHRIKAEGLTVTKLNKNNRKNRIL